MLLPKFERRRVALWFDEDADEYKIYSKVRPFTADEMKFVDAFGTILVATWFGLTCQIGGVRVN